MASVVPTARDEMIAFYNEHADAWETHAAAIGLSAAQALELKTRADQAAIDLASAVAIRQQSRAATEKVNNSAELLATYGAGLMSTIRGFAESTNNPNVYVLAEIPAPKPATPTAPPETPTMLAGVIRAADGAVVLNWSGSTAGGTGFNVYRRFGETGPNLLIGNVTGTREFIDVGIPACTLSATYSLIAVRNGLSSAPSAGFAVRFAGEGGGPTAQAASAPAQAHAEAPQAEAA